MSIQSLLSIQSLSLILLLVGIGLAFSQIRLSGWILGWILLSGAVLLQGFRSMLSYVAEHGGVDAATYTTANDWMGLGFSLLIVAAMHLMRHVFARHLLAAESLRVFSAAANDAIIIMDNTGTIAIWNQAAHRIFGYSEPAAHGRKIGELIVPERYRGDFENMFNHFGSDGRGSLCSAPTELAGLRKDGMEIATEYSIARVIVDGKWHAIYIVRDITARRQAEEALRRSEARQSKMVANIGDVIVVIDRDGINRYQSPNIEKLFGWRTDEIVGVSTWENVHPADLDSTQIFLGALLSEANASGTTECRYRRKDGSFRWIEITLVNLLHDSDIGGILGNYHDITERKHAQEALREGERRYRGLFDQANEGLLIMTLDGQLSEVNQAFAKMHGYKLDELKNTDIRELDVLNERALEDRADILRRIQGGEVVRFEVEHFHKDGHIFPLAVTTSIINLGGRPFYLAFHQDITERKRAEETSRRQSEQLRLLYEASQRLNRTLDLNEIYQVICDFMSIIAPNDALAISAFDAQTRLITCRAFLLKDKRLDVSAFPPVPLEEEGVGTQSIVIRTGQSMLTNDYQARLKTSNTSYYANGETNLVVDGLPPEEAIARSALIVPLKIGGVVNGVIQVMSYRPNAYTESQLKLLEALVLHIASAEQNALLYAQVQTELSERKQAEARRALLEAQLRESQKMEAIGTLAGGIAHDFNNIVATILGNTELARQDMSASPAALESLEEIRKAASRARDLVQQILSFSRRQPTERKLTALAPIVEESVHLLRATLPARLTLEVQLDVDVPYVLADATQIEQVLINLATNAMQAISGGSGRIGIRLDTVMLDAALADAHPELGAMYAKRPGRTARLALSDDGPGMDAATRARIFEPFFTTRQVGEGTGLGLSVVHGIVQGHEGAITVDSQPGKGATFTLYLSAAEAQAGAPGLEKSAAVTAPSPRLGGGLHILYIDDDESLVFLVQRLLERRGYRVSGYIDQREALAALRAGPRLFDLVVTDYNMPGMSGLDVAREVRAIRADLPVAVASGFIDEELRAQAGGAGVRELIFKADAVEKFCDAVQRLLPAVAA